MSQKTIEEIIQINEDYKDVKVQDDILFALDNMKNCVLGRTDMINNLERSEKINQIKSVAGKVFAGFLSLLPGVGGTAGQVLDCFIEASDKLSKDSEIKDFIKAYDAGIKKYNKTAPECEQKLTSKEIFEKIQKAHSIDTIKFNKIKNNVVKRYHAFLSKYLSKRLQEHDKKINSLECTVSRLGENLEDLLKRINAANKAIGEIQQAQTVEAAA